MARFTPEAEIILQARYLKKDKHGVPIETSQQMLEE